MCEPVSIMAAVGLGISAAAATMQAVGGIQQQSAAESMRRDEIQQNARLANASLRNQYALGGLNEQQANARASQEIQRAGIEAMRAQSSAMTGAGEAGVSGLSVDALMRDYAQQDAMFRDITLYNRELESAQAYQQGYGYQAQAKDRIFSVRPYAKDYGFLAGALGTIGQGVGGYAQFNKPSGGTGGGTTPNRTTSTRYYRPQGHYSDPWNMSGQY